jgi:hypothetical protein
MKATQMGIKFAIDCIKANKLFDTICIEHEITEMVNTGEIKVTDKVKQVAFGENYTQETKDFWDAFDLYCRNEGIEIYSC